LHDYIYLCPRIHLLDPEYRFCGLPEDPKACDSCVRRGGTFNRYVRNVGLWRQEGFAFLKAAHRIWAPSVDTILHYKKIFSSLAIDVMPHGNDDSYPPQRPPSRRRGKLRLAVVAHLLRHKGADTVLAVAERIAKEKLPIEMSIIGATVYEPEFAKLNVSVTGSYQTKDLAAYLRNAAPDYVWLSSPCPETYCFVLSEVWKLGYPVIAFDLGAPAERIRKRATGEDRLLPVAAGEDIPRLCAAFLKLRTGEG
jgi:glycosyltransferase involved in cell wall biosynthesis